MASGSTSTSLWLNIDGEYQLVTIKHDSDYVGNLALFYNSGGIAIPAIVKPASYFAFMLCRDNPHLLPHIKKYYPEMCI